MPEPSGEAEREAMEKAGRRIERAAGDPGGRFLAHEGWLAARSFYLSSPPVEAAKTHDYRLYERAPAVIEMAARAVRHELEQVEAVNDYTYSEAGIVDICETVARAALDAASPPVEASEVERLRKILDHPDPEDFINASTVEAKFQMDLWGTTEGFPTAFDGQEDHHFAYLIGYLVGKIAATPDEDREKKLHRITTVAAAAANWHIVCKARAGRPTEAAP